MLDRGAAIEADGPAVAKATAQVGGAAPGDVVPDGTAVDASARGRRRGLPLPAPAAFVRKSPWLAACYIVAATVISMTQGLGLNLITANLYQIPGPLGATLNETVWLSAAYLAPNVSLTLLLTKVRAQFGLRQFATAAIAVFVAVTSLHLLVDDIQSAIVVRFFAGVAGSPMSSLALLYMLESFPPERKLTIGISLAMTNLTIAAPLARLVSPTLLDLGGWNGLFVLESALALVSFCLIRLLPLNSPPKTPVIEPMDVVSYLFIAVGLGSLAVSASVGPFYWWFEAPWIGAILAVGAASLTLAVIIELNRTNPLIDIRWITSREIVHFAVILFLFRLIISEQVSGVPGFFQVLGLKNEQMAMLNAVMLGSAIASGLLCTLIVRPGRAHYIHSVALALLAAGCLMDAQATVLTRPEQMYLSQGLIAAGSVLVLPPAVAFGFASAMKRGTNYILSFLIVFLTAQTLGAAIGSALFSTFVTVREKFHSNQLVESIVLSDPIVAARISQLGAAYASVLSDPALRQAEGLALLGTQATQQANVLAYNDAFFATGILALLGLAALLLNLLVIHLRQRRAGRAPAAAGARP